MPEFGWGRYAFSQRRQEAHQLVFRPDDFRHAIPRAPAKAKGG
jgi:hypothetical protein